MTMFLRDDIYVDLDTVVQVTIDEEKGQGRLIIDDRDDDRRYATVSLRTARDILAELKAGQS
jgi:hypothetical protein